MFDTYRAAKALALERGKTLGEFVAELHIPEGAPVTLEPPSKTGHCGLYNAEGGCPGEVEASYLIERCLARVVHAPSHAE